MSELEYEAARLLKEKGYHIVFAESCTAGLAASRLVNVPSASSVIDVSFITYANEAKTRLLGVKEESIERFGVVSEEVAREMALGAAAAGDAEVGAAVSGIAGPTGGTPEKPVGTVAFAIAINGKADSWTAHFGDIGRNAVRNASAEYLYMRLVKALREEGGTGDVYRS